MQPGPSFFFYLECNTAWANACMGEAIANAIWQWRIFLIWWLFDRENVAEITKILVSIEALASVECPAFVIAFEHLFSL